MLFWWCNVIKLDWYILGVYLGSGAECVCVNQCQNLQFSLRRDMQGPINLPLLEQLAQARGIAFGRQTNSLRRVWLAQARIRGCLECVGCATHVGEVCFLGETASRSGESLSPKQEIEEHSDGSFTRSPSERGESWAKGDFAQASRTHLSESSWLVSWMALAQARQSSLSEVDWYT